MRTCALFLLGAWMCCVACTSEQNSKVNINVVRADSLLNQVLALYEVKEYGLLLENYPPKENLGWRNIGTVNGNPIVTSLIRCNSGIVTVIMMIMTGWLSTFVIIML